MKKSTQITEEYLQATLGKAGESFRLGDKRANLRKSLNSLDQHTITASRYSKVLDADKAAVKPSGILQGLRIYAPVAVLAIFILGGGGVFWLRSLSSNTPSTSNFTAEQLEPNGKLGNTINAISEDSSNEFNLISSQEVDSSSLDSASSMFDQLGESIDEKF